VVVTALWLQQGLLRETKGSILPKDHTIVTLIAANQILFFILAEETPALLLHLRQVFTETTDFGSAACLGCRRVVGDAQAVQISAH
jgi:hypothetical protein